MSNIQAEINITPLVDVVLVLLIILMVVGPFLQDGKPVALPMAAHPAAQGEDQHKVLVVVSDKGEVTIGDDTVPMARLGERMTEEFKRNPAGPVIVKADRRLTFGNVKHVLMTVRDAGYRDAGIVADSFERH